MDQLPAILTLADFLPFVGHTFTPAGSPDAATFALVEAKALPTHDYPGRRREAFVLIFEAETAIPEQGLRRFDLPGIGDAEIFLVPTARRDAAVVYEAVFN